MTLSPASCVNASADVLRHYATISSAFVVTSRRVFGAASVGADYRSDYRSDYRDVPVDPPFVKDYDAAPANTPADWARQFDVSRWRVLTLKTDGLLVGGAILIAGPAADPAGELLSLGGRPGVALLWDLRVAPPHRGRGVGRRLFDDAAQHARSAGCSTLEIETQDINAPACRFYARQGCTLVSFEPEAYPDCPGEAKLIWRLTL